MKFELIKFDKSDVEKMNRITEIYILSVFFGFLLVSAFWRFWRFLAFWQFSIENDTLSTVLNCFELFWA